MDEMLVWVIKASFNINCSKVYRIYMVKTYTMFVNWQKPYLSVLNCFLVSSLTTPNLSARCFSFYNHSDKQNTHYKDDHYIKHYIRWKTRCTK